MATRKKSPSLAVGDHIRLKAAAVNQHPSSRAEGPRVQLAGEPVDGVVLSIRDISTGTLGSSTTKAVDNYVIEILQDHTFSTRFASLRNAPRGGESASAAPAWHKVRRIVRDAAAKGDFLSAARLVSEPNALLGKLLDGWKVLKVRSSDLETLEVVIATPPDAAE